MLGIQGLLQKNDAGESPIDVSVRLQHRQIINLIPRSLIWFIWVYSHRKFIIIKISLIFKWSNLTQSVSRVLPRATPCGLLLVPKQLALWSKILMLHIPLIWRWTDCQCILHSLCQVYLFGHSSLRIWWVYCWQQGIWCWELWWV